MVSGPHLLRVRMDDAIGPAGFRGTKCLIVAPALKLVSRLSRRIALSSAVERCAWLEPGQEIGFTALGGDDSNVYLQFGLQDAKTMKLAWSAKFLPLQQGSAWLEVPTELNTASAPIVIAVTAVPIAGELCRIVTLCDTSHGSLRAAHRIVNNSSRVLFYMQPQKKEWSNLMAGESVTVAWCPDGTARRAMKVSAGNEVYELDFETVGQCIALKDKDKSVFNADIRYDGSTRVLHVTDARRRRRGSMRMAGARADSRAEYSATIRWSRNYIRP